MKHFVEPDFDLSALDLTERVTLEAPADEEACRRMKASTLARICIGRAGARYRTETQLRFRADHAIAMDAVWTMVDESVLEPFGYTKVQTLIRDKDEYLTRPDLGRRFPEKTLQQLRDTCVLSPDVQLVVADGLSAPAIESNLPDIHPILMDGLQAAGYRIGTPIFVRYGRVATMDRISEALGAKVTLLLVGERPGLAVGNSMSCYMAYEASTAKPESQRTVISNIHRRGTPPLEAGAHIVDIVKLMMEKRASGVDLQL
nr:ethanolamine ammonia-lyase subunit EutC [uncultured Holophaga sp.]